MSESLCRSCSQPVTWTITAAGKRMPVDALPSRFGNLELTPRNHPADDTAFYSRVVPEAERVGRELFVSHFQSCPQAKDWRKP